MMPAMPGEERSQPRSVGEPRPAAEEPAHDVLAAEAFAVPGPDPELRRRPVVLPEDPSGIAEPHDILAAEEFAMPAVDPSRRDAGALTRAGASRRRLGIGAIVALLVLLGLRRRRR
jgi:hypothetical protein